MAKKGKGKVIDFGQPNTQQQPQLKLDPRKLETVSCPNCGAYTEVYWGEKTKQEFDENGMYK